MRVSELCRLKLEDVDLDREVAYVIGKGSRPRAVPFGAKTGQAIDRHQRIRALHPHASSPKLLLGLRGAMTVDGVLEVRSRHAGLEEVHPHRFRHTSGSHRPTERSRPLHPRHRRVARYHQRTVSRRRATGHAA